jgi:hypothetical protein
MPAKSNFDYPSGAPMTDAGGIITPVWGQWFTRAHNAVASLYQSGPTTDRPTSVLWIGRRYYDTTLNKPVWVSAVRPTVWRDAAGAIV